jgi:hypothetical protein
VDVVAVVDEAFAALVAAAVAVVVDADDVVAVVPVARADDRPCDAEAPHAASIDEAATATSEIVRREEGRPIDMTPTPGTPGTRTVPF